jgi:Flp pilus assembly secretin CpaC
MGRSPATLRAAAAVQAVESAVVLAATVLAGVDTAAGRSYQLGSGIALTVIGAASAAALALVAAGLARARRWSRTPALLTQLFTGIVGIYLLQGQRFAWGVPLVVLAAAGFAALLAPPSLRALAGQQQARPGPGRPGR